MLGRAAISSEVSTEVDGFASTVMPSHGCCQEASVPHHVGLFPKPARVSSRHSSGLPPEQVIQERTGKTWQCLAVSVMTWFHRRAGGA